MSKLDQNTNHTKYNQTSVRTWKPGRHATGIKNNKKRKNVIFDSAWIAGVDYDEEIFDDEKCEEEEDTNDKKIPMSTIKNTTQWIKTS